tara:strand:- start:2457 stop:3611 length:1155 start_codon:yes stop_codon:yes gene_type:complete
MVFGSKFRLEWSELKRFENLSDEERTIIFYVENEYYFIYLKSIINELIDKNDIRICYVTSSKTDPMLKNNHKNISSFYIGDGTARTKFFLNLKAKILIMTMPDLQSFHIKRSKISNVHYVYVFHSPVSTHLVYRKEAFDNFDTVFCVGNFQIEEIRERESKYNLKEKRLIKCGYGRLDDLIIEYENFDRSQNKINNKKQIIIAPSWGENGIIETIGKNLIQQLLTLDYKVVLRPHPMTSKKSPKKIKNIQEKFCDNPNFCLEEDVRTFNTFFTSDCIISDWSGVAIESAFTTRKPVLFIDVPIKMRNPEYKEISITPLEIKIREQIGTVIVPDEIINLQEKIEYMIKNKNEFDTKIKKLREQLIFNIGQSEKIAAKEILKLSHK